MFVLRHEIPFFVWDRPPALPYLGFGLWHEFNPWPSPIYVRTTARMRVSPSLVLSKPQQIAVNAGRADLHFVDRLIANPGA